MVTQEALERKRTNGLYVILGNPVEEVAKLNNRLECSKRNGWEDKNMKRGICLIKDLKERINGMDY
jgi:hypothetical protein